MTAAPTYAFPQGGLPPQSALMTQRAVFTEAYAVIPAGCQSDIVTTYLPGWRQTRVWVLARPLSGFAETFSQYAVEIEPGGGSDAPDPEPGVEHVLFVTGGLVTLTIDGEGHELDAGGYAYIPVGADWRLLAEGRTRAQLLWLRKIWEPAPGLVRPEAFVTNERAIAPIAMPGTEGRWATTRFVDTADLRHDMHVNIVTLMPGGTIPFEETHVMEHGLFVLQGKATYRLNRDWVEVGPGDFMWLRAFCPQACYAGGNEPFRYLLYKDMNRHARLRGPWSNPGTGTGA